MSEQGWREFRAADGLEDWVVLHGGAVATFPVGTIHEAAKLAEAIAAVPGLEGSVLMSMGDRLLTVRLSRGVFQLEFQHIQLARAISEAARAHGAVADRSRAQEVSFAIAAKPEALDVGFWRVVLGYDPLDEDAASDPLGHGSTIWLQELDEAKPLRHAMHVDVSVARGQAKKRLDAALAAGGRIVWESEQHWTLADRAGNRVDITAWPDGE